MKLHTSLTETEIRACLDRAKAGGLITSDVEFDVFGQAGSRSRRHAWEVHLATPRNDTRDDGRKRPSAYHGSYSATYDEWGWFLAEFFAADPDAKAGSYKNQDHFHRTTQYAYATRDDMPEDARPADPEPEPEYASTEPTTDATTDIIERIDDTLAGCWANTLNP